MINVVLVALAIEWVITLIQNTGIKLPKIVVMAIALALGLLASFTIPTISQELPFPGLFGKVIAGFILAGGSRAAREVLQRLRS